MARKPQRARHGGRSQRDHVRHLLRGAVALGDGAIDWLLCNVRLLWRAMPFLRSKNARIASAAAAMVMRHWRDDPQPAGDPFLRRAVAHAGGAIEAMLHRGRSALAVIRNLPELARAVGRDFLQRVLRLVPEFLRRLLHRRQPCLPQRAETPPPPTPPPQKGCARMYENDPRRRRPRAPSTSPSPPPPPPPPPRERFIVDDEEVPEGIVDHYITYCRLESECPANWNACHFCIFKIQKSTRFTARDMGMHCRDLHTQERPYVCCKEPGCSARAVTRRGMFTFATHYLPAGGGSMLPDDEEWKH